MRPPLGGAAFYSQFTYKIEGTRLVVVGIFWAILTNDSLDGHMSAVRKLLPCLQMDELVYSTESDVNKLTQHFKINRKNRHFLEQGTYYLSHKKSSH